jgi:hypothetical protein
MEWRCQVSGLIFTLWIQIHLILSSAVHRSDRMSNACAIPRANIDLILSNVNRTKFNITLNKNTQNVGFSRLQFLKLPSYPLIEKTGSFVVVG